MGDTAPNICGYCGKPAAGYARIGDQRYCHGDTEKPTCYMLATRELTWGRNAVWLEAHAPCFTVSPTSDKPLRLTGEPEAE